MFSTIFLADRDWSTSAHPASFVAGSRTSSPTPLTQGPRKPWASARTFNNRIDSPSLASFRNSRSGTPNPAATDQKSLNENYFANKDVSFHVLYLSCNHSSQPSILHGVWIICTARAARDLRVSLSSLLPPPSHLPASLDLPSWENVQRIEESYDGASFLRHSRSKESSTCWYVHHFSFHYEIVMGYSLFFKNLNILTPIPPLKTFIRTHMPIHVPFPLLLSFFRVGDMELLKNSQSTCWFCFTAIVKIIWNMLHLLRIILRQTESYVLLFLNVGLVRLDAEISPPKWLAQIIHVWLSRCTYQGY